MGLYDDIKSNHGNLESAVADITDFWKEVDSIDDDVKDVVNMIDIHKCETVDDFDDLLSEIKDKLESVRGRLY